MWWKTHKWKVIVPLLIVAVLAGAFWYGGSAPGLQGLPDKSPAMSGAASSSGQITPDTPAPSGPAASSAAAPAAGAACRRGPGSSGTGQTGPV